MFYTRTDLHTFANSHRIIKKKTFFYDNSTQFNESFIYLFMYLFILQK
jgi:hypothetical protein